MNVDVLIGEVSTALAIVSTVSVGSVHVAEVACGGKPACALALTGSALDV